MAYIRIYIRTFQNNTGFWFHLAKKHKAKKKTKQKKKHFSFFSDWYNKQLQDKKNKNPKQSGLYLHFFFLAIKYMQIGNQTTASERLGLFSDLNTKAVQNYQQSVSRKKKHEIQIITSYIKLGLI